ncbi:MAG TPA: hypothetical protein VEU54_00885 [Steroidobacteraceae bacterium]|jgi:hypothetical protein|nr:hypothetical protein [Steroidobacteraceae bacterium]
MLSSFSTSRDCSGCCTDRRPLRCRSLGWRAALLSAVLTLLAACGAQRFDRSNQEVRALLYRSDGTLDDGAATAAFNARFPAGSKFTDLQSLVRSVGGRCGHRHAQTMCEIPTRGTVCVVNAIALAVRTAPAGDTIEHIEVRGGMTGC